MPSPVIQIEILVGSQRYHVRGVEFTFDQLKDKASLPFPMNDTGEGPCT